VVSEEGSYVKLVDACITQLKAQGPSRACNESKEEGEEGFATTDKALHPFVFVFFLLSIHVLTHG